ncbi:MAG: HAMP domain-containing sensor histidine kinase [Pseudomonadota bacterium]
MSQQDAKSPDKTIVERPRAHSNDESRSAVRSLRNRLGSNKSAKRQASLFLPELLQRHVELLERSRISFVVVVGFIAYLAQLSLPISVVVPWAVVALAILGWTMRSTRLFNKADLSDLDPVRWERSFQILAGSIGAFWAVIFWLHPILDPGSTVSVVAFAGAMVLIGLTLISMRYLRHGVLLGTLPFILVVVSRLVMQFTAPAIGMAIVLVGACLFFMRLGSLMRESYLEHLKSKAERDQLIVELEASRGISDEARRRAEEANLAKSRFLATMSHELRTPLNAILGFSEVIAKEIMGPINNEHYKEYVGDIHSSGSHLLKLINEILDLSRVEAGRYKLNEEAANLTHAAEESRQMVKLKASEKNITIVMQIQPDLPQIWADVRALRQIILNLLSNAIKFTPSGGTVWLKCGWTVGGGQYVSVKDTGPGIAEDEIPIVLSSFGQGSIAIKSAEQGTGLGLPIVQALVHMHDGHFELKSKLREGTEVIASFPRKRVLEVMEPVPGSEANAPKRGKFTSLRRNSAAERAA